MSKYETYLCGTRRDIAAPKFRGKTIKDVFNRASSVMTLMNRADGASLDCFGIFSVGSQEMKKLCVVGQLIDIFHVDPNNKCELAVLSCTNRLFLLNQKTVKKLVVLNIDGEKVYG